MNAPDQITTEDEMKPATHCPYCGRSIAEIESHKFGVKAPEHIRNCYYRYKNGMPYTDAAYEEM